MNLKLNIQIFKVVLVALMAIPTLASCDLMHDTRDNCPEGLFINFVYDYNIHRADIFKDHVGEVTAYIFDENGYFVKSQTESNSNGYRPLADWAYQMNITDLTPGYYQIVALAQQRAAEEIAQTAGAKYRRTTLQPGDSLSKLYVGLDRGEWKESEYPDYLEPVEGYRVPHQNMPLDTLWHGMDLTPVTVVAQQPTYTTISLMRDTKTLHISLRQVLEHEAVLCDVANYDFYIVDNNDTLWYDNSVVSTEKIVYTPFIKWNTHDEVMTRVDEASVPKTAHAQLDFNRLMHRNYNQSPAILYIYNNKNMVQVARINLSDMLQQGRGAFDYYGYSIQEYLDREYSYNLAFYLKGDMWEYINLSVSILPWVKRIQNVDL